MRDRE